MVAIAQQQVAVILTVDDTPANLLILEKTLRAPRYRTLKATSGDEALKILEAEKPDLILLDIMMPGTDGFAVCRELKKKPETSAIPVIFLTALSDAKYLKEAFDMGAVDYINKPFQIAELEARVQTHLEMHRLRSQLEREVERQTCELRTALQKLENANREILKRISLASEYRDNETSNHLKRMGKYSVTIARQAGLPENMLDMLELASPMHDVGKIGIPDAILLKPAKLTPEEFAVMKTHPEIGHRLLTGLDSEFTQVAASIALTHHERFDGTGYPAGLAGEDIPLEGRIVAIADVFDALTTDRPYKRAWDIDEAIRYITDQSGSHFDPRLVECFQKALPEILQIRENFKN